MGVLRRYIFQFIYPLPLEEEDSLAYKQKLIDEYTQFDNLKTLLKICILECIVSSDEKRSKLQRSVKDKEQRVRLEAHKVYRKMLSHVR